MTTRPDPFDRQWDPGREAWTYDMAAVERQASTAARANDIVRRLHARQEGASIIDGMLNALEDRQANRPRPTWPGVVAVHDRAAEHVVYDTTGAATVNQPFTTGTTWVAALAEDWTRAAMPITAATAIVEIDDTQGLPVVPTVTTVPEAGPQPGEKQPAYSKAFTVGPAATTTIDSTLYLNWSLQLEGLAPVAADLGRAMQQAAVAAEADRQIGAAIGATGTPAADFAAAGAVFDASRFLPSVLLLPPGQIAATGIPAPADLAALGIRPVVAHIDNAVLLGAGAVTGWLMPLQMTAVEPSRLGTGRAWAMWGAVAVDPTGVAIIG